MIRWLRRLLSKRADERANIRAYWDQADAYLKRISPDEGIPVLDEYCWDMTHQGGWSCRECWAEQQEESRSKHDA